MRLGFVSADFARHPIGFFYVRAVECLRAENVETVCYSNRTEKDDYTARFKAAAHVWRDVRGLSDEALAQQIRADRIDVLFDLSAHTAENRLLVFARKPAPIQIAWAGPTGLAAMDYILADGHLIPAGCESFYREKVLRMPDVYGCYAPDPEAPQAGPLPALSTGQVTFGSLNNFAKITPQVIETWAAILGRLPRSRLVLRYGTSGFSGDARRRFVEALAAAGIAADRLELAGWVPFARRLDLYQTIDVGLDPFPYSGSTTTCEALWMGVPVITYLGATSYSRGSLPHLVQAGLAELAACERSAYIERAVALAEDLPRLAAIRAHLRSRMAASPLCDGPRLAANLMALLRDAWRQWVASSSARGAEGQ